MDEATARLVVLIVSGAGLFVWAWGLRHLQAAYRACRREAQLAAEQLDPTQPPPINCVVGSAEVEGEPAELAARAGSLLAMQNAPPIGQLKLLRRTGQEVAFEGAHPGSNAPQGGWLIRRGQLQFTSSGPGQTRIDYAVELAGGQALLWWGVGAVVAGAVALVGGFAVMWLYVVPHADPSVRGQVWQIFQVAHFLWPPFLFASLYRRRYNTIRTYFDTLIHNLPFVGEEVPVGHP